MTLKLVVLARPDHGMHFQIGKLLLNLCVAEYLKSNYTINITGRNSQQAVKSPYFVIRLSSQSLDDFLSR